MSVLEEVSQMQRQGMTTQEIASTLRQKGYSPRNINDAIGQAQIKSAVSQGQSPGNASYMQNSNEVSQEINDSQYPSQNQNGQMQPSIMSQGNIQNTQQTQEQYYQPQAEEMEDYNAQQSQMQAPPTPQYYEPQNSGYDDAAYANAGQNYDSYAPYSPSSGMDTDTVFEVAEQVFLDKIKEVNKKLEELNEFKTVTQTKVEHIDDRLHKIESIIDKLQAEILHKVGSYGDNLESIKNEMSMMQDSMGKMFASSPSPSSTSKATSNKPSSKTRKR